MAPATVALIGLIVSLLGTGAGVYGTVKSNQAAAKARRDRANGIPQGTLASNLQPTALGLKDSGALSHGGDSDSPLDAFKGDLSGSTSPMATPQQQGFSLKSSLADIPPPREFENSSFAKSAATMPAPQVPDPAPVQASAGGAAGTAGQIGSYAQLAMQLAEAFKKEPPQAQPLPQAGQINMKPTALKFI